MKLNSDGTITHYVEVKTSSLKGENAKDIKFVPADERKTYKKGDKVKLFIVSDRGILVTTREKEIASILGNNPFIKTGKVILGLK